MENTNKPRTSDKKNYSLGPERYNGWSNRETWAVSLYISNDQYFYSYYVDMLNRSTDVHDFARELETWFTDMIYDLLESSNIRSYERGMILDIGSLWRVNWLEIVEDDYPT